jgi:hypothetical protein
MMDIFILNDIWAQDKIYILVGIFAWLKYFTYPIVLVLAPNYKPHILSRTKVRQVCYSLVKLYVKSVYLNSFQCTGLWNSWHIWGGAWAITVWEHLLYTIKVKHSCSVNITLSSSPPRGLQCHIFHWLHWKDRICKTTSWRYLCLIQKAVTVFPARILATKIIEKTVKHSTLKAWVVVTVRNSNLVP